MEAIINKNPLINNFIIGTILIQPITNILEKLENDEFRDCDIKWLNNKLEEYTKFALETLDKKFIFPEVNYNDHVFNEFIKSQFLNQFTILLNYFKSI